VKTYYEYHIMEGGRSGRTGRWLKGCWGRLSSLGGLIPFSASTLPVNPLAPILFTPPIRSQTSARGCAKKLTLSGNVLHHTIVVGSLPVVDSFDLYAEIAALNDRAANIAQVSSESLAALYVVREICLQVGMTMKPIDLTTYIAIPPHNASHNTSNTENKKCPTPERAALEPSHGTSNSWLDPVISLHRTLVKKANVRSFIDIDGEIIIAPGNNPPLPLVQQKIPKLAPSKRFAPGSYHVLKRNFSSRNLRLVALEALLANAQLREKADCKLAINQLSRLDPNIGETAVAAFYYADQNAIKQRWSSRAPSSAVRLAIYAAEKGLSLSPFDESSIAKMPQISEGTVAVVLALFLMGQEASTKPSRAARTALAVTRALAEISTEPLWLTDICRHAHVIADILRSKQAREWRRVVRCFREAIVGKAVSALELSLLASSIAPPQLTPNWRANEALRILNMLVAHTDKWQEPIQPRNT